MLACCVKSRDWIHLCRSSRWLIKNMFDDKFTYKMMSDQSATGTEDRNSAGLWSTSWSTSWSGLPIRLLISSSSWENRDQAPIHRPSDPQTSWPLEAPLWWSPDLKLHPSFAFCVTRKWSQTDRWSSGRLKLLFSQFNNKVSDSLILQ